MLFVIKILQKNSGNAGNQTNSKFLDRMLTKNVEIIIWATNTGIVLQ
jgi:hypothetical protein